MKIDFNRAAFVGLRLRVVQQLIDQQGREVLRNCEISIPSVCVSVFVQIAQLEKANVTELIDALRLSRQTVLQRLKTLESADLIFSKTDVTDRRYRILGLTPNGQRELKRLALLLEKLDGIFDEIGKEVGVDLVEIFASTENALKRKSLVERLSDSGEMKEKPSRSRVSENV